MPSFPGTANNTLTQDAVVQMVVFYRPDGEPVLGRPMAIKCLISQMSFQRQNNVKGGDSEENSTNNSMVVDRRIPIGSRLWIGKIQDYYSRGPGASANTSFKTPLIGIGSEVMEVTSYSEIPDPANPLLPPQKTVTLIFVNRGP
jgi:hypothetical protein